MGTATAVSTRTSDLRGERPGTARADGEQESEGQARREQRAMNHSFRFALAGPAAAESASPAALGRAPPPRESPDDPGTPGDPASSAEPVVRHICIRRQHRPRPAALDMHPTLLESDRSFLRFAECAFASVVAHFGVILSAVAVTHDGTQCPPTSAKPGSSSSCPPDRVDVRLRQTETIQWGKLGGDIEDGKDLAMPGEGRSMDLPDLRCPGEAQGKRGPG